MYTSTNDQEFDLWLIMLIMLVMLVMQVRNIQCTMIRNPVDSPSTGCILWYSRGYIHRWMGQVKNG
ncbi:hypothetical protein ASPWEDRAFT_44034 [Aspergillus wentii DTO 134E9]|uniref:Uncharacterized protein n=1 Tax=Aspergillus wentii DTO 134E9 TaxID=1073089 RepID=A0A1L9RAV1_ASPWE|nr:uncharacterized protein ASPWEDRAFT_44034 [Aspergillus wentii DTO 134E9]OJJ32018.1 hypothetical protein ASPWEDRAFT_44034 [Aspergillus wentii DTO 134E9]